MNSQIAEAGDLVQRAWLTNAQKRRWVRLKARKGSKPPNPHSIGMVLSACEENSTLQVLWSDIGPEEVNVFRVHVVKKGGQP